MNKEEEKDEGKMGVSLCLMWRRLGGSDGEKGLEIGGRHYGGARESHCTIAPPQLRVA